VVQEVRGRDGGEHHGNGRGAFTVTPYAAIVNSSDQGSSPNDKENSFTPKSAKKRAIDSDFGRAHAQ
jgi:hypothetical protein